MCKDQIHNKQSESISEKQKCWSILDIHWVNHRHVVRKRNPRSNNYWNNTLFPPLSSILGHLTTWHTALWMTVILFRSWDLTKWFWCVFQTPNAKQWIVSVACTWVVKAIPESKYVVSIFNQVWYCVAQLKLNATFR